MATKISNMSAAGALSGTELVEVVKAGASVRTTAQDIADLASSTIPADSVTNAMLANVATATIKGRTTAGTGDPEDLTASQVRTLLSLVIGTNVQAWDADLDAISGLTATTDNFIQAKSSAWASRTVAQVSVDLQGTGLITDTVGFRTIPQNNQSTAYTCVAADSGKHILHPSADTTARTMTIPANSSVAYPVGTALTFVNQNAAGVMTISITTDTMRLAGAGTTGSRTLAANGIATALKVTSTEWIISGTGLT